MIEKAFRVELKPTRAQIAELSKFCKIRNKCYNWMLDKYYRQYEYVSSVVEAAFKRIAVFDDISGVDVVLEYTFIGIDDLPPSKRVRVERVKNGEKRRRRTNVELDIDHAWFDKQMTDPGVIARRREEILKVAPKWKDYLISLWQWRDLPKDVQKGTDKPKRPKIKYRLWGLAAGDQQIPHAKKLWRAAVKEDPELEGFDELHSTAVDAVATDLGQAYSKWKSYVAKPLAQRKILPKIGYPRVKEKSSKASFRIRGKIDVSFDWIDIPKIGRIRLKEVGYLPVGVNEQQVTISTHCDRWFVSVIGKVDPKQYEPGRPAAGVDVGVVRFAAVQPENAPVEYIENPENLAHGLKRLKMLQRFTSRKHGTDGFKITMPDGSTKTFPKRHIEVRKARRDGRQMVEVKNLKPSNRWEKAQKKVARCHYRIANRRKDFQHKATTDLVQRFGLIGIETLHIRDMMACKDKKKKTTSKNLRRRIGDSGWGGFQEKLKYKGSWHGTHVHQVPDNFPSTMQCSRCLAMTKVGSRDRICRCPQCGLNIDRDENAARNILAETKRACGGTTTTP